MHETPTDSSEQWSREAAPEVVAVSDYCEGVAVYSSAQPYTPQFCLKLIHQSARIQDDRTALVGTATVLVVEQRHGVTGLLQERGYT